MKVYKLQVGGTRPVSGTKKGLAFYIVKDELITATDDLGREVTALSRMQGIRVIAQTRKIAYSSSRSER